MSKEAFVMDNLHRISGQIAEAARKGAPAPEDGESGPESAAGAQMEMPREKPREKLSPETERALQLRHEEYKRFKSDLAARLTETEAEAAAASARYRKSADEFYAAEMKFAEALRKIEHLAEPDVHARDYQIRLAEACRTLELIRLEMIAQKGRLEYPDAGTAQRGGKSEINLFSDMASISFSQLFRIGFGIGLPLLIVLLVSSILIGAIIALTFRLGI